MANKILNLDFSKDPIMPPIIYGRVGDEKMQTITVKISRRDEIPDLSGGIITFEGEPAGGKVKVFDSENVSSNNAGLQKGTFEYTFPSAAFSVEGTYKRAYFSFQKDGKRDTTGDFKIIVKGNADIDAGEAETIITEYNKLVKALNEAYQAALNKMNTDYDDVEKRIEAIKVDLNTLKKQITDILVDAEGRISAIGKSVTDEVDAALEKFKEGNFYTKQEADNRFLSKTENLDIQNKKLTNDDGSGLPLPKGVTSFKELSGYAGFYYLNATVVGTMTDKAELPPEFKYSALYVYQHAIAGTAGSMYQEIRMNSLTTPLIAFRTTSPNSSQNSPFKIFATTDSVVNLTDIENGALVSKKTVIKAQDWNEILDKGIYTVFGASGINRPYDGAVYGVLVVYADNTLINQTYIYKGETYIRSRQGSPATWTTWNKMIVDNGQFDKFVYKQSGSPDTNVVSQLEVTCIRIGNVVTCHIRVNVAKTDTEPKNNILLMIPEGFRATYATGAEDLGAIWNIPFAVNSTATPSTQKVVKMHLEPGNNDYPNRVTLMSGQFGNQYGVCTWTTDDPYPKIGNVGNGTVVKLKANSNGSFTK
ncbi:BppU family phage baseplate upper protein [Enterococcus sp. C54]|uniref:BppU family phage baseplate upper protein n=1 Tax=Enterococcus sp. C54 TaxID=3231315 RepID=UPI0034A080E6